MKSVYLGPNLSSILAIACFALTFLPVTGRSAQFDLSGEEARKRMEVARDEIANVRSNVFLTLLQLDQVRNDRDPQHPQFTAFTNQLVKMQDLARAVGKRAQDMKQKGSAYFMDWEARTASIQNPEARKRAQDRYAERRAPYDSINKSMQNARANFLPLVAELTEIKTILMGDRNPKSIAAAKDLFMRANWHCVDVQRALLEIEAGFDELAASFAKDE